MRDEPSADEILAAIARQLRVPVSTAAPAEFLARVTAGAVELVRRDLALGPSAEAAEADRLRAALGGDGELATLNTTLAECLRDGRLDLSSPGVREHLWATTLAKLAIDQPRYASYRAVLAERGLSPPEEP